MLRIVGPNENVRGEVVDHLGRAKSLKERGAGPSRLQPIEGGSSLDQLDSPCYSPSLRGERYFSNQNPTSVQPNSSQTQPACRENPSSLSNDDSLYSPLEFLQKDQCIQWINFGLCVGILTTTSQIAFAILRKLNYTQELVKKMTNKGIPKKLFFWIRHPNPGPGPEKALFHLMVGVLIGNAIILYTLMKIMHLFS